MSRLWLLVLAACSTKPWGMADITVTGGATFPDQVAESVARWNEALHARCGRSVFRIVEARGKAVREYTIAVWRTLDIDARATGYFNGDEVAIRCCLEDPWGPRVTTHELGHALGLKHLADPASIMNQPPTVDAPSAGDVARAAAMLGCD